MNRSYLIYGGMALAVAVGGFILIRHNAATAANVAQDTSANDSALNSLYPGILYSGAGGSTGTSTTDALTQALQQQATKDSNDYTLASATLASNEKVSLATLDTQKVIALDTNQTAIEQSLAAQLGDIALSMKPNWGALGAIAGNIGFANGKITLDLAGTQDRANGRIIGQANVDKARQTASAVSGANVVVANPLASH